MNKNILILIAVLLAAGALIGGLTMRDRGPVRTPTSADDAPPGSIHNLPVPEAVAKVRSLVAQELGTREGLVIIQSALEREWPNSCLGLEKPGEFCAQVIVPGYEVVVEAEGQRLTYRTNQDGSVIIKE